MTESSRIKVVDVNESNPDGIGLALEYSCCWKIKGHQEMASRGKAAYEDFIGKQRFNFETAPINGIPILRWYMRLSVVKQCGTWLNLFAEIEDESLLKLPKTPKVWVNFRFDIKSSNKSYEDKLKAAFLEPVCEGMTYPYAKGLCLFKLRDKIKKSVVPEKDGSLVFRFVVKIYADKFHIRIERAKSLFWKNASINFASLLENPDESGADLKVIAKDGKEFKIHKLIISARIPAFITILKDNIEIGNSSGVIKLDDVSSQAFEFLLHYIYSGDILPFAVNADENKEKACISELISLADKYGIKDLLLYLGECWDYLSESERDNIKLPTGLANKLLLQNGNTSAAIELPLEPVFPSSSKKLRSE